MSKLPMNLSILEAVVAVAETGSFSQAADVLGVSQSAISARIRTAENILGVELFTRTTRRVLITPHGERLRSRAENAIADLKAVFDEFRDEEKLIRGRVRVGATPTVSAIMLPEIVRDFRSAYPGIDIIIRDDFFGQALERVAVGDVDFALSPSVDPSRVPHIQMEHLLTEDMVLLLPVDHPLTQMREPGLKDIADHAIVSMPAQAAIRAQLDQAFASEGLTFTPAMETMHALSSIAIVKAGLAVAIVPEGLLKLLDHRDLVALPVPHLRLGRGISIATAKDRSLPPVVNAFINVIRHSVKTNGKSSPCSRP
ncbi:LysR family transcriptional regulator (plasmid) [Tistrella bauzanensis]|uniref:LysR family transcriptional regulator n=1 Tax=Tistrella arctica TaxID=3133430 RepID=A0ABU9YP57_9PROT